MATISAIRDGLKTVLAVSYTQSNGQDATLRMYDTVPDQISPPCGIVIPERCVPRTVTGTRDEQNYRIQLVVGRVSERTAQDLLDGFLASSGTSSLRVALQATSNLGISGVKAIWDGWENYGAVDWGGVPYLGVDVLIRVEN